MKPPEPTYSLCSTSIAVLGKILVVCESRLDRFCKKIRLRVFFGGDLLGAISSFYLSRYEYGMRRN